MNGCVLNKSATISECEGECKALTGCVAAVFAEASCSGAAGPICWLKSKCNPHSTSHDKSKRRAVSLAKAFPFVPAQPAVPGETDRPADVAAGPLTVGGQKVYGIRVSTKRSVGRLSACAGLCCGLTKRYCAQMDPPSGYRRDNTTGIAIGDQAASYYAVMNGSHYNNRCCFDYGNAETNDRDDGAGTMEAIYFGSAKGGLNHGGAGKVRPHCRRSSFLRIN